MWITTTSQSSSSTSRRAHTPCYLECSPRDGAACSTLHWFVSFQMKLRCWTNLFLCHQQESNFLQTQICITLWPILFSKPFCYFVIYIHVFSLSLAQYTTLWNTRCMHLPLMCYHMSVSLAQTNYIFCKVHTSFECCLFSQFTPMTRNRMRVAIESSKGMKVKVQK